MFANNRSASVSGPRDVERQQLEEEDERHDRLGQPRRHECLVVADEALLANTDCVVDEEDDDRQRGREPDAAHRRELHRRDDAEQVVDENERERGEEQRHELQEVVAADDVARERVADQAVRALGGVLTPRRHHRHLLRDGEQDGREQRDGEHQDDRGAGDREGAVTEPGLPEVRGPRCLEAVTLGGGEHHGSHGFSSRRQRARVSGPVTR
jgi:hypothetical protein